MERLEYIHRLRKEQYLCFRNQNHHFNLFWYVSVVSSSVIKIVFIIIKKFGLNSNTKYIALNLYDKCIKNQFQEIYKENRNDKNFIQWKHLRNKIVNLSKIRLISCIQLASKLDSHSNFLRVSQGVTALKLIDFLKNQQHEYFFETLLFSEFSVCKVISFQMLLITPLDCIEVLISILNFQNISELRSIALDILDIVLIQGQQLLSKLQSFKFCSIPKSKSERLHGTTSMTLELDLLCLSSSIIVCALSYLNIEQAMSLHIVQKLSSLIYINSEKIIIIAYIIRSIVNSC
ncbi:GSCOCG00012634001-RA-CDS [Cotesia congregata]|nr:GSCOCG00012634001-RA-CDS [Cotesia congregata]